MKKAPTTFAPTFYRTYSRLIDDRTKESWNDTVDRCIDGIKSLGGLSEAELISMEDLMSQKICLPSGRWLWLGGTEWVKVPKNYSGAYNCSSTDIVDISSFGDVFELCMCGCGIGANLEHKYIDALPTVKNKIYVEVIGTPGEIIKERRQEETTFDYINYPLNGGLSQMNGGVIIVGDSRKGWVDAYQKLINLAFDESLENNEIKLFINVSNIRGKGEKINGFGGKSNPNGIKKLFTRVAQHLSEAVGRQLTSLEVCLIINEAGLIIEESGIRRSAGIVQFDSDDEIGRAAKQNLWMVDENGNWRIDLKRDALRMANHTFVYHKKPTLEECIKSVEQQYHTGEGAMQYAPEAIARANADILNTESKKKEFMKFYEENYHDIQKVMVKLNSYAENKLSGDEIEYRIGINGLNPCISGDTMVFTDKGVFEVNDIVGEQVNVLVNGESFPTTKDGFFCTGEQEINKLLTVEGFSLKLTSKHKVLVQIQETEYYTYTDWKEARELKLGDKIFIHNHELSSVWDGEGSYQEGILSGVEASDCKSIIKSEVEKTSYDFYMGFLEGLYKNNGKITFDRDARTVISLWHTSLDLLKTVQRMLLRIGVVGKIRKKEVSSQNGYSARSYNVIEVEGKNIYRLFDRLSSECFDSEELYAVLYDEKYENQISSIEDNFTVTFAALIPCGREKVYDCQVPGVNRFDANGLVVHNCGEILLRNNYCNLSEVHLNLIEPLDLYKQSMAFEGCALFAAPLLKHTFTNPRYQKGRELDPIVGVSISGVFDFFVSLFGTDYVLWLDAGRPKEWHGVVNLPSMDIYRLDEVCTFFEEINSKIKNPMPEELTHISFLQNMGEYYEGVEKWYYNFWRVVVEEKVAEYCDREGLKKPNRCTTIQPSGTKSLLTGGSPGIHFSWGKYWIRRIKFVKEDPVALACQAAGYNIVPGQNDKDENGNLLTDINNPLCTEWLVEIPCKAPWLDHVDEDRLEHTDLNWPALGHFRFYMNAQREYVRHNGSVTINFSEDEIVPLATEIHEEIGNGYMSAALISRFDAPFPRLPYERISKEVYTDLMSKIVDINFVGVLNDKLAESKAEIDYNEYQSACSSGKCQI